MRLLTREIVLAQYELFPFEQHPLWQGILRGDLSVEQVLKAEIQHYHRSKIGRDFRRRAAEESATVSARAHELLMETYLEECTDDATGPSHLALIERLLVDARLTIDEIETTRLTPGNIAAIAIYKDITDTGPLHHMIGAGAVEYYYSELSPKVYDAYISIYGMTENQAETYRIHGPMDREHAERALAVLDEVTAEADQHAVIESVRRAFIATSLHYDGMLQAALGQNTYWGGQ